MKQRIFVYEYLSGGGLMDAGSGADPGLHAMGLAMRDAITQDLSQLEGVTVSCASGSGVVDPPASPRVRVVRPERGESPFGFVRRHSQAHDLAWIVAPESGGVLACMRKMVPRECWIGCDSTAIRVGSSKGATVEHLSRHGLCTPWSFVGKQGASRWVVKPDDGAGGLDTRVHGSFESALADHLARRKSAQPPATLEPWVDGEPMSLSLLCRPGHAELLSINRQHIRIDGAGTLHYEGVEIGAVGLDDWRAGALRHTASKVARAMPGLRGFAGIDFVWHPSGPVVIEVNPRVTCAYVGLSAALRRPLAAEIVAMFMQKKEMAVVA